MFGLVQRRKNENGSGTLASRAEHPLSLFRNEFDTLFDRFFAGSPEGAASGWGLEVDEND